ncbi:MAG: 4Fe-4S binding protein [bacterium]|nr:4Fe-4S binding protein [bacterium]
MVRIEVQDGKLLEAIGDFFRRLLTEKIIDGLLVPQEIPSGETVVQTLVTSPEKVTNLNPVAPVLPQNSAVLVSKLTGENLTKKVACLLRPCEMKAVVELVKLKQASLDKVLTVGIDCFGTYPVPRYVELIREQGSQTVTDTFLKSAAGGEDIPELRPVCSACLSPEPASCDLTIRLFGNDTTRELFIEAGSPKGEEALAALKLEEADDSERRPAAVEKVLESRRKKFEELKQDIKEFLATISSLCINCQNCRDVCPLCYCEQCVFEGPIFDYKSDKYVNWASKKGTLKMPTDTYLFHITRMNHMISSCIGCGQCEEACPNNIPVGRVFYSLGTKAQKLFDYQPGRSLEDEMPLSTFKEDELQVVEN